MEVEGEAEREQTAQDPAASNEGRHMAEERCGIDQQPANSERESDDGTKDEQHRSKQSRERGQRSTWYSSVHTQEPLSYWAPFRQ